MIDYSLTGSNPPSRPRAAPQAPPQMRSTPWGSPLPPGYGYDPAWPLPPAGHLPPEGFRWHEVLGDVPMDRPTADIDAAVRAKGERDALSAEERRRETAAAAEHERSRPRTLEERIERIEARLVRLEAPTRIRGRARTASRHHNDDHTPEAA
jgi:hypothetical protein